MTAGMSKDCGKNIKFCIFDIDKLVLFGYNICGDKNYGEKCKSVFPKK